MLNLIAQISNPVLPQGLGGNPEDATAAYSGSLLTDYIVRFWRTLIVLGGLAALLFFLLGAFDWITAGGDEGKVKSARQKITQGLIGLAILAASVALAEFFSFLLGFDLLELTFPRAGVSSGGGS